MALVFDGTHSGPLVLCIGDSITVGTPNKLEGSYRAWLWHFLRNRYPFELTGQRSSVDGPNIICDRNEGVSGNTIAQISARQAAAISTYSPEIVILCAGTNDIAAGSTPATALTALGNLVDDIADNPTVARIIVTDIPIIDAEPADCATYNAGIAAEIASNPKAVYQAAFATASLADGVHPDLAGHKSVAVKLQTSMAPSVTLANKSFYGAFWEGRGIDADCIQFLLLDEASGTLADASGNANTATIPGSATYRTVPPLAPLNSYCMGLSGAADSYISAGAILTMTQSWTVALVCEGPSASADGIFAIGSNTSDSLWCGNISGDFYLKAVPSTGATVSLASGVAVPTGAFGIVLRYTYVSASDITLDWWLNGAKQAPLTLDSRSWAVPTQMAYGDCFGWSGGMNEWAGDIQHRGTADAALSDTDCADLSNILVVE